MELTQISQPGRQVIECYGPSGFRVSGTIHLGPVLVFADTTIAWTDAAITRSAEGSQEGSQEARAPGAR